MRSAALRPCVALAGGGTAGHLSPALAVAAAYRARHPDARVIFVGHAAGFGARLVDAAGYRFEIVAAAPYHRVGAIKRLRAASRLVTGALQARRLLVRHGVQLVLGFGGYASAGAVLAGRSLGLATAVHECNALPGLTNRLLAPVVDRVYLGDLTPAGALRGGRPCRTGTPLRPELAGLAGEARRPVSDAVLRLLVCGGSEGSPFLNRHAPALAQRLADGSGIEVRHQCGRDDPSSVAAAYARRGVAAAVASYVDDMAAAYRWADLALAAAGAATLAELAAAGLPALLVPLAAAADDHQVANAAAFAAATGAPWVRESEWDAALLARSVETLRADAAAWSELVQRTRALARPAAAAAIVDACDALLRGRRAICDDPSPS